MLKQFRQEGCVSHLFFDPSAREAVIIDPRADLLADYRAYAAENRLKLTAVIDTRLHWHHLSGSHLVSSEFRVPVAMSHRTDSARVTSRLKHGDRIRVGALELRVHETPGVSIDAICLGFEPAGLVFTGDTLLIGAPTRTDLPGGDPAALWASLREVIGGLPDSTVVLPSYDLNDLLFSTLRVEKARNPDLQAPTCDALVDAKRDEKPRGDADARRRLEYNAVLSPPDSHESHFGGAGPASEELGGGVASIGIEKLALKVKDHAVGTCFLDVREKDEFDAGHIPGAMNIPLSEIALHLGTLGAYRRIYVSCQTGRRSHLAARTLDYLGLPDVVNVGGGFKAWAGAGFPVEPKPASGN